MKYFFKRLRIAAAILTGRKAVVVCVSGRKSTDVCVRGERSELFNCFKAIQDAEKQFANRTVSYLEREFERLTADGVHIPDEIQADYEEVLNRLKTKDNE